jgi:putative membrane protein
VIRGYTDHSANERTFLAWVRTAIAIIAFGFVVEKFDLFVITLAGASLPDVTRMQIQRLSGPFARYDGLALIAFGIVVLAMAVRRFVRTTKMLDDQETHATRTMGPEYFLSGVLAVMAAAFILSLLLG